ncbi:MAG: acetate--CoA ligase family protein [Deltaproteobacteria bacterium]|nr:acetate--CoA ligase family protein [Deltaproteobacteria bacterium]
MHSRSPLTVLFSPASIALLGSFETPGSTGNIILSNLAASGFNGKIFPIHPDKPSILGLPALRNLKELGGTQPPVDLTVIALPAGQTVAALKEIAQIHGRAALVVSSGFKETGHKGAALEKELVEIARNSNIILLGPNCPGLINPGANINISFSGAAAAPGNIGFFSQSGAMFSSFITWTQKARLGISTVVGFGNKAMLNEADILAHMSRDAGTGVIAGYIESIDEGVRFMNIAQLTTRNKPVILMRASGTSAGARAASAHTGAVDGLDMAYEAAFKQTGIIRAQNSAELFYLSKAFASQPLPQGPGLAVVSNAGGTGIIAADACEKAQISMASLSEKTIAQLKNILPPYASFFNPVVAVGEINAEGLAKTAEAALQDRNVHSLLVIITPSSFFTLPQVTEKLLKIFKKYSRKPIFCCFMGEENLMDIEAVLGAAGYPLFSFPEPAVHSIAAMYKYKLWKDTPMPVNVSYRRDIHKARGIIASARTTAKTSADSGGAVELPARLAHELFHAYEMPVLKTKMARTSDEAVQIAKQFGQSVALKIASPQITHKTDVRGVALRLDNPSAIRSAFTDITARVRRLRHDAYIAGCFVQEMAPNAAHEITIGFKRDSRFGAMLFFGFAGLQQEVFKDLSCRIVPLSLGDVQTMLREIRGFPVLTGTRKHKTINLTAIEDVILILSQLAQDFPEIQEADCTPVFVSERGAVVADMRVLLSKSCE